MVARGLNVTVLCGLEGLELEGVGGGKSGDVSVEAEAIAGMKLLFLTRVHLYITLDLAILWVLDRR